MGAPTKRIEIRPIDGRPSHFDIVLIEGSGAEAVHQTVGHATAGAARAYAARVADRFGVPFVENDA